MRGFRLQGTAKLLAVANRPVSFFISHRYYDDEREPHLDSLPGWLTELDERLEDVEHDSVAMTHETGWTIEISTDGRVTLENVEDLDVEPRHLPGIPSRQRLMPLLAALARGAMAEVERAPWERGYR